MTLFVHYYTRGSAQGEDDYLERERRKYIQQEKEVFSGLVVEAESRRNRPLCIRYSPER